LGVLLDAPLFPEKYSPEFVGSGYLLKNLTFRDNELVKDVRITGFDNAGQRRY